MRPHIEDGQVYTPAKLARFTAQQLRYFSELARVPTDRVVDLCCGNGELLSACAVVGYNRDNLDGVDINADAVQGAQQRGFRCCVGDLFDLGRLPPETALICNPPYVGCKNLRRIVGEERYHWLKQTYTAPRAGSCDLAGYVFRHTCEVIRPAVSAWITTNTIAQGSTRRVGLQWALAHGYRIVGAWKDIKWPGRPSVIVHVFVMVDKEQCDVPEGSLVYVPNHQL